MKRELDILETDLTEEEIEELSNSIEDIYKTNYEDSIADLLGCDFDKEEW